MLPKERVINTINHDEPDRVPLDFWPPPDDAYTRYLQQWFRVDDFPGLLERLHVDFRWIKPVYCGPKLPIFTDGRVQDHWGVIWKYVSHQTGVQKEIDFCPLRSADSTKEIEEYNWPDANWFDYSTIEEQCDRFSKYAICAGELVGVFWFTWLLRGLDRILSDIVKKPAIVDALAEKITHAHYQYLERILQAGKGKIDILLLSDDLGTQQGPMMSTGTWKRFFANGMKTLVNLGKKYNCKILVHSCGSIKPFIPLFIEMGVDILNPIQVRAADMDPAILKNEFGKNICFHGSIDIQRTLPLGTPYEVKNEVKERLRTLSPGGGFIMAPTHRVQSDTKPENLVALYDYAYEEGRYLKKQE